MADREGGPWIPVPERLDRRLRLGPFPSGREAVKFVTAAAVGAVVSLVVEPWAGLPIIAVGAILALWRPDGEGLDERLLAVARWALRRSVGEARLTTATRAPGNGQATLLLPDGRRAAVVRTAGVPLAFLPPADLARQFELYRELLRSVEGGLISSSTAVPIHAGSVLPTEIPLSEAERGAEEGYRELVSLLCRRRSVRRVLLALAQDTPGVEGPGRLEAATQLLQERLADLGVRSERLRDRPLADAARRLGLIEGVRGP
jgi:hypothetical protein